MGAELGSFMGGISREGVVVSLFSQFHSSAGGTICSLFTVTVGW